MSTHLSTELKLYCIDNGPYLNRQALGIREKIFNLWQPLWSKIYIDLGSSKTPTYADFNQYDVFHCLTHDEQIVGITAHRFLNLNDPLSKKAEFLQSLGDDYVSRITELGAKKVMTFESLLVAPEFRKKNTPQRVSKLLVYFGNYLYSNSIADAIIAAARRDVKASQLSLEVGYQVLESDKQFRVFPCDLNIQLNRNIFYPNDPTFHLSQELWNNRETCFSQQLWQAKSQISQSNKKTA